MKDFKAKVGTIEIEGIAPLLMKNIEAANELNPLNVKIKEILNLPKSQKDPFKDWPAIANYEFRLAIYYNEKLGPVLPDRVLKASIRDGGKLNSNGKKIKGGLQVLDDEYPLIYEGPRKLEKLIKAPSFRDTRFVGRSGSSQGSKVPTTRPIFWPWGCKFQVAINEDVIKPSEIDMAVTKAGVFKAMGDYRPDFGRFKVVSIKWE